MKPKYCFIIDCGLKPLPGSLVEFYKTLENDENLGGVCGFMTI